ncbi:PH domain-containing protein [Oryzihumus sp.]
MLLGLYRLQRTVVTRSGVWVRSDIRARILTWDQIAAVHDPGRWAVTDTLTLTTTTGEQVATHIPRDRHAALESYATAHRGRTSLEPGQSGEEGA